MTNVVLVFCEGKNDQSFLVKLLEKVGKFSVVLDPLGQFQGMYLDRFLNARFENKKPTQARQTWQSRPPSVLQDGSVLYLLYDIGGKDVTGLIHEAIEAARFISRESSHLSGLRFSYALIYDADHPKFGGGYEVRRQLLNQMHGDLLPLLLNEGPAEHFCFEGQGERLGLYIFPRNGDDGTLEDLALDTLEDDTRAKFPAVETFLSTELKGLKGKLDNPGNLSKAVLTTLVQPVSPGSSLDVALKKLAKSKKMETNPHCQNILGMFRHLGRPW